MQSLIKRKEAASSANEWIKKRKERKKERSLQEVLRIFNGVKNGIGFERKQENRNLLVGEKKNINGIYKHSYDEKPEK